LAYLTNLVKKLFCTIWNTFAVSSSTGCCCCSHSYCLNDQHFFLV